MINYSMADIMPGVRACVCDHGGVKKGENVLILTDTSIDPIVPQAFSAVVCEALAKPIVLVMTSEMPKAAEIGGEISAIIVEAVKGADVVFGVTSYPMQHTPALRDMAAHAEEPVGTLHRKWINVPPPHHINLTCGGAFIPGKVLSNIITKQLQQMRRGLTYHMTTESGTDVTTTQDPKYYPDVLAEFPLPAGRFQVFPFGVMNPSGYVHKDGNGVIAVDAVDAFYGKLASPIRFIVKDGYVKKVEGGPEADWIEDQMRRVGRENGRPWWEFSMGSNPCIPIFRNNSEVLNAYWHALAHRAGGVVHLAFGIDPYFHLHATILAPTITCVETGEIIIERGRPTIFEDDEIKKLLDKAGVKPSKW
jgi:2,5-dihydroxypyridine 5,6-dioxygenase